MVASASANNTSKWKASSAVVLATFLVLACHKRPNNEELHVRCVEKIGNRFSGVGFVFNDGQATFAVDANCSAFVSSTNLQRELLNSYWSRSEVGDRIRPVQFTLIGTARLSRNESYNPVFEVEEIEEINTLSDRDEISAAELERYGCSLILREPSDPCAR